MDEGNERLTASLLNYECLLLDSFLFLEEVRLSDRSVMLLESIRLLWADLSHLRSVRSSRKVKVRSKRSSISATWPVDYLEVSTDRSSLLRDPTTS